LDKILTKYRHPNDKIFEHPRSYMPPATHGNINFRSELKKDQITYPDSTYQVLGK